jgi:hypothetical protein
MTIQIAARAETVLPVATITATRSAISSAAKIASWSNLPCAAAFDSDIFCHVKNEVSSSTPEGSVRKFIHDHVDPGVFAPDAVRTLIAAFDGAWQSIAASGARLSGQQSEVKIHH